MADLRRIYVTQNVATGEFVTVKWLPATGHAPPYIAKLIVAALKTLQASYDGAERYERTAHDHFGNQRVERYQYAGMLEDNACWQMDADSSNFDQANEESRKICWAPGGGVVQSTTGDLAEIGTADSPSAIIDKMVYQDLIIIMLSDNGTVSVSFPGGGLYEDQGFRDFWGARRAIDVGTSWLPRYDLNHPFFIIDEHGVLYANLIDTLTDKWSQVQNYNHQPVPFRSFAGGSQKIGSHDEVLIWAIDYKGAIWASAFGLSGAPAQPWKNFTNPDAEIVVLQALQVGIIHDQNTALVCVSRAVAKTCQFYPWSGTFTGLRASIYGFYVSGNLNSYIL